MSLLGDWTKTPGRRPAAGAERPEAALELRLDGRRDNVALLYFLALVCVADHLGDGLVGISRDNRDFCNVLGTRLEAVDVQHMAHDEAVVGTDRQFEHPVGRIDFLDFT